MLPEITPEIFAKLVEADKLRQVGDKAGAQKIMSELGFKKPVKPQGWQGKHHKGMTPPDLTAEQKKAFDQARTLFHAGNYEEAEQLLDDAGITPPFHQ
jgi:predicted Zn-dependent protease